MIISEKREKISNPAEAARIVYGVLCDFREEEREREHFFVIGLDNKNVTKYVDIASIGTLNQSLIHPREIFRLAITTGCAAIILAHNHPSGDTEPSQEDKNATLRLKDCGDLIGIPVLDHVIVGDNKFISMKEVGYM